MEIDEAVRSEMKRKGVGNALGDARKIEGSNDDDDGGIRQACWRIKKQEAKLGNKKHEAWIGKLKRGDTTNKGQKGRKKKECKKKG